MLCHHLQALEKELKEAGFVETYRGSPWTENCREWVFFDVVLDTAALAVRFSLPTCVKVHENLDARSGTERGFVCTECHDAVMGVLAGDQHFG